MQTQYEIITCILIQIGITLHRLVKTTLHRTRSLSCTFIQWYRMEHHGTHFIDKLWLSNRCMGSRNHIMVQEKNGVPHPMRKDDIEKMSIWHRCRLLVVLHIAFDSKVIWKSTFWRHSTSNRQRFDVGVFSFLTGHGTRAAKVRKFNKEI